MAKDYKLTQLQIDKIKAKSAMILPLGSAQMKNYSENQIRKALYAYVTDNENSLIAFLNSIFINIGNDIDDIIDVMIAGITANKVDKMPVDGTADINSLGQGNVVRAYARMENGDNKMLRAAKNVLNENFVPIRGADGNITVPAVPGANSYNATSKGYVDGEIDKIENGTTVVDKALKDDLGNTIKSTYANKLDLAYSSSNNRIAVTLKSYDGTSLDADLIDLPKATPSKDGLMPKEDKAYVDGLPNALALKENKSEKGVANGYASLDGSAKIHTSQLPDSILGQLEYKGTFNPSSGYPVSPEKGWFYIAIANALISGVDYKVGDWAVYNGVSWDKVDNTDAVASVNGKIGVVVLNGTDIEVGGGDSTKLNARFLAIDDILADTYRKSSVYTKTEVDNLLDQLKAIYGWEDSFLGELEHAGYIDVGVVDEYDFVIINLFDTDSNVLLANEIFKPTDLQPATGFGAVIHIDEDVFTKSNPFSPGKPKYTFYQKDDIDTGRKLKVYGVKLKGLNAYQIDFNASTIGDELERLENEKADKVDVGQLDIESKKHNIAIDNLESSLNKMNVGLDKDTVSGEDILSLGADVLATNGEVLVEGVSLYAKQLVTNGDFSDGTAGWSTYNSVLTNTNNELIVTSGGLDSNSYAYQLLPSVYLENTVFYVTGKIKTLNTDLLNYSLRFRNSNISVNYSNVLTFTNHVLNNYVTFKGSLQVNSVGNNNAITLLLGTSYSSSAISNNKQVIWDDIQLFNISTLIANKQYSPLYNKTFDLMTDPEIKAQMDKWVQDGTLPNNDIQSVGGSKRIKSVGKNLFDRNAFRNLGVYIQVATGNLAPSPGAVDDTTDYIKIKPNTSYALSPARYGAYYDKNKVYISGFGTLSVTTPSNAKYIRFTIAKTAINTAQIEESPSATAYQPYASNDLYLDSLPNLNRLPNGVKDTIEYRNGKYYFVKRVQEYVLQASDVSLIANVTSGVIFNVITTGMVGIDTTGWNNTFKGMTYNNEYIEKTYADSVENVNTYYTNDQKLLKFHLALGTTQTQARDLLSGKVVYYQLATPIETEITSIGTLLPQPNGTVYITNEVAEVGVYTDKFTATRVIKEITELYLLNPDGSKTKLTGAVLTNNTFTHASLTEGDLVFVSYIYAALDGRTTLTYKKDNIARKSELDLKADQTYTDALFNEASDNLILPVIVGKTQINGIYKLRNDANFEIDYDVKSGIYTIIIKGKVNDASGIIIETPNIDGKYTAKIVVVEGIFSITTSGGISIRTNSPTIPFDDSVVSVTSEQVKAIRLNTTVVTTTPYTFKCKLQLAKSENPRSYQVPISPQLYALKQGHINSINWQFVNEAKQDKIEDSGWQTMSLATDILGEIKYRKLGNQVFVKGNVRKSSGNFSASTTIGQIANGYRPTFTSSHMVAGQDYGVAYVGYAMYDIKANGEIVITNLNGTFNAITLSQTAFLID